VRFHGLLLGFIGVFLFCSPAKAGKLMFWQFLPNQNRLTFTTDDGVQPQAQLLSNPTRLVIDLPETTLERQTIKKNYGDAVKSLRVGQFENQTTRLVLELAPGYTLDPQQIKFLGTSPTQWSVNLHSPSRDKIAGNEPLLLNSSSDRPSRSLTSSTPANNSRTPAVGSDGEGASVSTYLRVTRNGIFVNLNGNNTNKVKVSRSSDRNSIDLELENIILPRELVSQTVPVNSYGVSAIQFSQTSSSPAVARLSLQVNQDSPDWIASFSRFGGLVIVPKGGLGSISSNVASNPSLNSNSSQGSQVINVPPPNNSATTNNYPNDRTSRIERPPLNNYPNDRTSRIERTPLNNYPNDRTSRIERTPLNNYPTSDRSLQMEKATVESVQLQGNGQLMIKADRMVIANGNWNRLAGVYEIRVSNAQLAESFTGPQFDRNSPISELRVRQEDNSILLLMRPALGVRFGELNQLNNNLLALELEQSLSANAPPPLDLLVPPISPAGATTLPSDRPLPSLFPRSSANSDSLPPNRKSGILVVIDPGHGGKDPGAIGIGGVQEKEIILDISQQIDKILEKQGLKAVLTRSSDYFVSLEGRTDMANRMDADLFVSIHANSINLSRQDVSGLETYYYKNGKALADTLHRNVVRSVKVQDRGVKKARFYVLRHSEMPAALVEVGYVTGADDAAKLRDPSYRRQMAEAIARGIIEYIQRNRH
jgi:N-acetylmuramoyl-L-alanine amidase